MSEIGGENGISGQAFADFITSINERNEHDLINVFINGPGGRVMDGISMFFAIINSKIPVHTHIVGDAASMLAIVALAGHKVFILDFARLMIHEPRFAEDFKPTQEDITALEGAKKQLATIITNKTHKTEKQIKKMFASGDTWINAVDAKKSGFVDEIVKTDKEIAAKMAFANIVALYNPGKSNDPKPDPKIDDMKNICELLGLTEGSSEEIILDAMKKVMKDASQGKNDLTAKITELEGVNTKLTEANDKIMEFEAKQTELNEQLVEETIDAGVKDGKFDEKDKDELTTEFKDNLTGLKLIVGKIKDPAMTIIDKLGGDGGTELISEKRKDWGYKEWMKEDPKGLEKLKELDSKTVIALYQKSYPIDKHPKVTEEYVKEVLQIS